VQFFEIIHSQQVGELKITSALQILAFMIDYKYKLETRSPANAVGLRDSGTLRCFTGNLTSYYRIRIRYYSV